MCNSPRGLSLTPTPHALQGKNMPRTFQKRSHFRDAYRGTSVMRLIAHLEDTTSYSPAGRREKKSCSSMRSCCDLRSIARTSSHGMSNNRVLMAPTCTAQQHVTHRMRVQSYITICGFHLIRITAPSIRLHTRVCGGCDVNASQGSAHRNDCCYC